MLMTQYAKMILELINQSDGHLTAEQLFLELKKKAPKVVQATVYNNLNKICEAGLIRKVSVEGMPDRYDTVKKHDHLVCRQCGRILDITFEDFTAPLREQLGEGFLYYDLKVYYLCPECRTRMHCEEMSDHNG